jgi:hypothetical protein
MVVHQSSRRLPRTIRFLLGGLLCGAVLALLLAATCVRGERGPAAGVSTPPLVTTPGPTVGTPSEATTVPTNHPTPWPTESCYTPIPVTPIATETEGDGSTKYSFDTNFDGTPDAYSVVPPSDFDPFTASDAQLEQFGYPPRPTNPDAVSDWERLVEGIGGSETHYVEEMTIVPCESYGHGAR